MSFYVYETSAEKKGDVGMDAIDIARRYLRGEAGFDARDLNGAIRRLIEQAERVQVLEKDKMRLRRALKHITVFPTYFSHEQHSKRALKIARKALRGVSNDQNIET